MIDQSRSVSLEPLDATIMIRTGFSRGEPQTGPTVFMVQGLQASTQAESGIQPFP